LKWQLKWRRMNTELINLLNSVKEGKLSVNEAAYRLKAEPFLDLEYAKIDTHRKIRQGASEVIYGAGKTACQIQGIVRAMLDRGQELILITRMDEEKEACLADFLKEDIANGLNYLYNRDAHIAVIGDMPKPDGIGKILVATGGTSDIPVAEEAAITAAFLGNEVVRAYDVGVAGIHRLLDNMEDIMTASVIIAIAGMEGALASVIGGLADCPVIAVPTSVGYGAAFEGLSALLSMLNSCASGVSVVNIDNGFGAGYMASMINHMKIRE